MRSIKWRCFRWPCVTLDPQTTPIFAFFDAFHIFVVSKHRDFIFCDQVAIYIVPADGRQTVPERGVIMSCGTFQSLGTPSISQEWLKLELSNFVQRETNRPYYIKSCQKDENSFYMRNCGRRKNFVAARCYSWDHQEALLLQKDHVTRLSAEICNYKTSHLETPGPISCGINAKRIGSHK